MVYPIKSQCCPHIETSQLICIENQLSGFCMRATLALNGLNYANFYGVYITEEVNESGLVRQETQTHNQP